MHDLSLIRDTWLDCYKQGDVSGLMKYESEMLIVSINGVIDSGNRYNKIQERVISCAWFQPQMNTVVTYQGKVKQIEVAGYCEITSGKYAGLKLQIKELWNCEFGNFRLVRLDMKRDSIMTLIKLISALK